MIQAQDIQQTSPPRREEGDCELGLCRPLFELTSELICFTDTQARLKKVNPAFAKTLGYGWPEIQALGGLEKLMVPEDRRKVLEQMREAWDQGRSVDFECRFLHREGKVLWLLWNVTPIPDQEMLYWVARDITERKNQEAQKEYSDRLLKHTVNSLPFFVAYLDLDFKYKFMNKAYERWLGDMVQAAKNGDMERAVGAEFARSLHVHREEAIRTGKPNRFEGHFQDLHDQKVFLEVQYHPHLNSSGEVEGLMALAYDITKIKEANRSMIESETKLQRVLSTGKIGYWEINLENNAIAMSDNIRDWLGLSQGMVLTHESLLDLVHPEDRFKVAEAQRLVVETHRPQEVEFRTRHPDGHYVWTIGAGYPTYDENNRVIGVMGISVDVTDRKLMEQTLRTQQARMMASSRLSAIGEMASGVAHEINNPLAIIFSNAESLKMNSERGRLTVEMVEKAAGKIESTVMRISKIIHSLRSLSRDSERDPFEPVSIRKIVDDAMEICNQRFKSHQIQLRVRIPTEDIVLHARPTQISQVLLNLLNNAHDAVENLENRWVEVAIRDLGDEVEMAVTDSGPGVPQNLQEKIFDPFFTTKDPTKGTGLGLSVSKNIITSHGGSLRLNSEAPTTQFLVRLPKNAKLMNQP